MGTLPFILDIVVWVVGILYSFNLAVLTCVVGIYLCSLVVVIPVVGILDTYSFILLVVDCCPSNCVVSIWALLPLFNSTNNLLSFLSNVIGPRLFKFELCLIEFISPSNFLGWKGKVINSPFFKSFWTEDKNSGPTFPSGISTLLFIPFILIKNIIFIIPFCCSTPTSWTFKALSIYSRAWRGVLTISNIVFNVLRSSIVKSLL